jgi:predicted dehydrogenase
VCGVAGTFNSPPGVEVEDLASGSVRLSNGGVLGVVSSSCYLGGLTRHLSILGTRGQLEFECGSEEKLRVFLTDAGGLDIKPHEWVELPVPPSGRPTGYAGLMDEFAASVQDGAPVPVDPRDALHTLATVLAIYGEADRLPRGYGQVRPGRLGSQFPEQSSIPKETMARDGRYPLDAAVPGAAS